MAMPANPRFLGPIRPFDPMEGVVIREPPGQGPGYWAGAPGVYANPRDGLIYLLYRLRRPRGDDPDRGGEVRMAVSEDGLKFDDLWTVHKAELDSASIERCCMTQAPNGNYLLYLSYVDPADNRWRTDVVASPSPQKFEIEHRQKVFTANDIASEGVKDPWVISLGGVYVMLLSYATLEGMADDDQLHSTADAYNTGLIKSRTGLATSLDGLHYVWQGDVFSPLHSGWDSYAARISCLWYRAPVWVAFYDGSASVAENYEERCGLAVGTDPRRLLRATMAGPWLSAPEGSGSIRYLDVLPLPARTLIYYEMARPDGSHELRCYEYLD